MEKIRPLIVLALRVVAVAMAVPVGELRAIPVVPRDWASCDDQLADRSEPARLPRKRDATGACR